MTRRILPTLFALQILIVGPFAMVAAAAESVGTVQLVKIWAYEKQPPKAWENLVFKDEVYMNQWLRTVEDGALHVEFLDGTRLRMGAKSEAVIDRYLYNPTRRRGEIGLQLSKGVFRFITGGMNKNGVRIETPSAWLGVRGTDFTVHIGEKTIIHVISGVVVITPKAPGGATTVVTAGQTKGIGPGDTAAAPAVAPSLDYALSKGGGILSSGPEGGESGGVGDGGGNGGGDGGDGGGGGGGGKR